MRAKQIKTLVRKAESGDPNAMVGLGSAYSEGSGVPMDPQEALRWYRRAAELGWPEALATLGFIYKKGEVVPRDQAEALKWFQAAAEKGHWGAQLALGHAYFHGEGVDKNEREGLRWTRLAASHGRPEACFTLGAMLRRGKTLHHDLEAVKCFRRAAMKGFALAHIALANAYVEGEGVERNIGKANYHYWRAARRGHVVAQYALGCFYRQGQVGAWWPRWLRDAIADKWLRKAAEQGHAEAEVELSRIRR